MKKLALAALLGLSAIVTAPAMAANATDNVSVSITLTPKCEITTPTALNFAYTSFQTGAAAATGGAFTIKCTTSLPYKLGFDSTATPATTKSVAAAATNMQLAYTLGLSASTGTGTGTTAINVNVTGSMPGNQSGTCATTAGCTMSESQAIYVVY